MEIPNNQTRHKLLDVAEELFSKRGYTSVKLRDIAAEMDMRHASLYYYAPGGKEQLFVEVMERSFTRHRDGLTHAIESAGENFRDQMMATAEWLINQTPLNFSRMIEADMHELQKHDAERLMQVAYDSMRLPITPVLEKAQHDGLITVPDFDMAAMAFVTLIQSVHNIPFEKSVKLHVGHQLVDMLLNGWLKR